MCHFPRVFFVLLFIFPPFSSAQETHDHGAPDNWGRYLFRFPADKRFSNSSTEASRCSTHSPMPPLKLHSATW
jgi:hypothetical protein